MHFRGKLLKQAVIIINCIPFQNGNFQSERILSFRAAPDGMGINVYGDFH